MKKFLLMILILCFMFSLVGCMEVDNTTTYRQQPTKVKYQGYRYNSPEEVTLEITGDYFSLKSNSTYNEVYGQVTENSSNRVTMHDYNSGERFVFYKNEREDLIYSPDESTFNTRNYISYETTFRKQEYIDY